LKDLNDKFKEEELLKVDGNPQNKIVNVKKFSISKIKRPVINDNVIFYEVQLKGYKKTTNEPRDVLLKDVPKKINQYEKKNTLKFYVNTNK
jgi:hypothetical protein